jgi:effector-binding domain-containing protein
VIKSVPAQAVASIRQIVPTVGEMGYYCQTMYQQLYQALDRHAVTPLQPEITLYHTEEYTETDLDVETAVPVQPKYLRQRPPEEGLLFRELPAHEQAAALIYEGPFGEMLPAVLALVTYVGTHRHVIAGPLRELHLSGPAHDENGADHPSPVVELQIPIHRLVVEA